MFLTCIDDRASSLSDHQRPRGVVESTVYPVTVGRDYPVLGIVLWENVLSVLIPDDWGWSLLCASGPV